MRKVKVRLFSDAIIISVLAAALIWNHYYKIPYQNLGFYLNDRDINYPRTERSINFTTVFLFGTIVTILWLIFTEILLRCFLPKSSSTSRILTNKSSSFSLLRWFGSYLRFIELIFNFLCGIGLTNIFTDLLKRNLGKLRPNFLELCQMNLTNYANYTNLELDKEFFKPNICSASPDIVASGQQSFPSGHVSVTTFCAIYILFYTYLRIRELTPVRNSIVLITILCLFSITDIAGRQIIEYWHHPIDVLAGFLLGLSIAIAMILCLTDDAKHSPKSYCLRPIVTLEEGINDAYLASVTSQRRLTNHMDNNNRPISSEINVVATT